MADNTQLGDQLEHLGYRKICVVAICQHIFQLPISNQM